jgi:hypothetical protein
MMLRKRAAPISDDTDSKKPKTDDDEKAKLKVFVCVLLVDVRIFYSFYRNKVIFYGNCE